MVITIPSLVADPDPAVVELFDGPGSLFHVGIGYVASLNKDYAVPIFAGFAGYQVSQAQSGESWESTGGEFIEFAIGYLLGMWTKGK